MLTPYPPTTQNSILQVITDIDDTVKSSGGVRLLGVALGGIDTQYRRGQYYPGAFQFALELSRFGVPEGGEPQRVAVLTARAREFKVRPRLLLLSLLFYRAAVRVLTDKRWTHLLAGWLAGWQFALELKPTHKVCRTYARAGAENGVEGWGVGTVLYGSVKEWCVCVCVRARVRACVPLLKKVCFFKSLSVDSSVPTITHPNTHKQTHTQTHKQN